MSTDSEIQADLAETKAEQQKAYAQREALKLLGSARLDEVAQFTFSAQAFALKVLGNERVEDALKFTKYSQFLVLRESGTERIEDALKFE